MTTFMYLNAMHLNLFKSPYCHMSINLFNVFPMNPRTLSRPPYLLAVIKTAKLTAKTRLSNFFAPPSLPSRMDADCGTGRTVAKARGATYSAISPRRFGSSRRIDQPQRRQPTRGPVVASQMFRDLEGKRVGPRRERVRQTPYLELAGAVGGRDQVSDTNVARKEADRIDDRMVYCTLRLDIPRSSNRMLMGK
jgi:hypothetical protein